MSNTQDSALEKSGRIQMTTEDMNDFRNGIVSARLKAIWDISLDELERMVVSNNVDIID